MNRLSSNGLRAVLFDFDGTLIDSFAAHRAAYLETFARFGLEISGERLAQVWSPNWFQVYQTLGLPEQLWEEADAFWLEAVEGHESDLFPGVPEMLAILAKAYTLAIVTAGERFRVEADLARTAIGPHFRTIVTGDDVTRKKPDPQGLEIALAELGVSPDQALYVGDTEVDWRMAQAAGMAFVGIAGPTLPDHVNPRLPSPRALPEALGLV